MEKITIPFAGTVIIDRTAKTLKPSSHLVGQKLLVGYPADTTQGMEDGRMKRRAIEKQAGNIDWDWLDHNGHSTNPQ